MNRIFYCPQNTPAWDLARRGRITASGVAAIMAELTSRASYRKGVKYEAGSEAIEKADYRVKLRLERTYHHIQDNYVSRAMDDGIEREPYARMLFEAETGIQPTQIGFGLHATWDWMGCSPDGLLGDYAGLELKSPTDRVHDAYCDDPQVLIEEYKWQCLTGLVCFPSFQYWALASFNPYAPGNRKLLRAPDFQRSDWAETIKSIEDSCQLFNDEIEAEIAKRGLPATVWDIMPDEKPEPQSWPADLTSDAYNFVDGMDVTP